MNADGVAARFGLLCADPAGTVRTDLPLWDTTARAALLVDLALAGRLHDGPEGIELDGRPTGSPAADRLLATMTRHPGRPLRAALADRRVRLADAVEPVRTGWARRLSQLHRVPAVDPVAAADTRAVVQTIRDRADARDGALDLDPADAALTLFAGAVELVPEPEQTKGLRLACGDVQWIADAGLARIDRLRRISAALQGVEASP